MRNYKQHLDLHILPLIGNVKLSKLTRPAVESFRDELLETRSRAMAAKVMVSLKSLLSRRTKARLGCSECSHGHQGEDGLAA